MASTGVEMVPAGDKSVCASTADGIDAQTRQMTTTPSQQRVFIVHPFFAIRYRLDCVRMIRLPRATAGVASDISPSEFLPRSLNSGPACTTNVSPSSLNRKIFPLYAQGDAVNPLDSADTRCRP